MERVTSSQSCHFPALLLFRDDLDEFYRILTATCKRVEISDDECRYESLDEFQKMRGDKPRVLKLVGSLPHVSLELKTFASSGDDSANSLHADGSDAGLLAYHKIRERLNRRRRFLGKILNPFLWMVLCIVFPFAAFWAPSFNLQVLVVPFAYAMIGSTVFIIGSILVLKGNFSKIHLNKRFEQTTFWSRHSTQIIPVLAALLGAFAKTLFDRLWASPPCS